VYSVHGLPKKRKKKKSKKSKNTDGFLSTFFRGLQRIFESTISKNTEAVKVERLYGPI